MKITFELSHQDARRVMNAVLKQAFRHAESAVDLGIKDFINVEDQIYEDLQTQFFKQTENHPEAR